MSSSLSRASSPSSKKKARGALGALGALALLGASCAYAPNPKDGTLGCSANLECPEGYSCRATDHKCWGNGAGGASGGAGGTGGMGGAGGTGGVTKNACGHNVGTDNSPTDKLVGCWVFDGTSMLTLACGASTMTKTLKDDWVYVEPTAQAGTVKATYYCGWNLDEGPAGNAATIQPGQSCTSTDPTSKAVFTWNGTTFTFGSLDGKSATLSSMIDATYVGTDATTGKCTIKITGKLAK
jgi:hypothetical protein